MNTYEDVLRDYYVELERLGMDDDFPVPESATCDDWIATILGSENSTDCVNHTEPTRERPNASRAA
jgi:hypothetical protein